MSAGLQDPVKAHHWLGYLASALGDTLEALGEHDPKRAERILRATLAKFITTDVASEELRAILRRYMK